MAFLKSAHQNWVENVDFKQNKIFMHICDDMLEFGHR